MKWKQQVGIMIKKGVERTVILGNMKWEKVAFNLNSSIV